MKRVLLLLLSFLFMASVHSQILKKLGNDIKNKAEWKIRSKANQKIDQALDTILAQPKKITKKETSNEKNNSNQPKAEVKTTTKGKDDNNMDVSDGYITLFSTAEEVFKNGTVVINGKSLKYGNFNSVKLVTEGPEGKETKTLPLDDYNNYSTDFGPGTSGDYVITAFSSNGKVKESVKIKVLDIELTNWDPGEDEIEKAEDKLKEEVEKVEESLGNKDKEELEKKMDELEEKVKIAKKLYEDLGNGMKELGQLNKKGVAMPPPLNKDLSQLNNLMNEQRMQMQKLNEAANHQPSDNTICEYLVMVNEACAAFSAFSNVWSKSLMTIIKNIEGDKLVPKVVEDANASTGTIPADYDAQFKQPAKIFAASKIDAAGLSSRMGAAGFAGDIIQFASDFLMKKYCGIFKGELKHDYTITYRNRDGATWWSYTYETQAAVTFRYPKSNSGKLIKMKGNIEGNATKFKFFQNIELMDDFRDEMKKRAKLIPIELFKPVPVPFATSQKDDLGFGAAARALVTPSYFNIPVDAEYDTDAETVKLFINQAIIDFTPLVKYTYGYIAIAAGIPLITKVDFPINKARLTLNAVVSQQNELKVSRNPANNLIIQGEGSRHIGNSSSSIEHLINYSLTAKN